VRRQLLPLRGQQCFNVSKDLSEELVLAQYIQRAVQGAKGSVITFAPSTVVKFWGKWFGHGDPPERLVKMVSILLNRLVDCGLLKKYGLYKYQLVRGGKLWSLAERGALLDFLKGLNCYSLHGEEFNAPWARRELRW